MGKRINVSVGEKFHSLTVIRETNDTDSRGNHIWEMKCDCGNIIKLPRNRFTKKHNATRSCGCSRIKDNLIGRRFTKLLVLSIDKTPIWDGCIAYNCLCDCGNEIVCSSTNLRKNKSTSCGCIRYEKTLNSQIRDKVIPYFYFQEIELRAKRRNINFDLTHDYLKELLNKQNFKCALSGLEIKCSSRKERRVGNNIASLDKIDPKLGYVMGNVQWVHKDLNFMKQRFDQEKFIHYCTLVANNKRKIK